MTTAHQRESLAGPLRFFLLAIVVLVACGGNDSGDTDAAPGGTGPCDVIAQECGAASKCTIPQQGGGEPTCMPSGLLGLGDACTVTGDSDDCGTGGFCVQIEAPFAPICYALCRVGESDSRCSSDCTPLADLGVSTSRADIGACL